MKKPSNTKLTKFDVMTSPSDLSLDAKIFVHNSIHADVLVETTNKYMIDCLQRLKAQLQKDGKDEFLAVFRSITKALLSANVDEIYMHMKLGRESAKKAWQNLCDDAILYAVCKHILYKRPIVIVKPSEKYILPKTSL